jgi:hypothetical protein
MLFFCVFASVVGQPMGNGMPDDVTLTFVGGPGEGRVSLPGFGASLPMIDLMKGPPLEIQKMMEGGGGADQIGVPRPGDHGDAFTDEILQKMGFKPIGGFSPNGGLAAACQADIQQYCVGDKQVVHCLSQHADSLKEDCRAKVQKTLPHICKPELETMCDPYNEGIFACLERNIAKLKGKCLDTFVACRHHIDAAASGTGEVRDASGNYRPLAAPSPPTGGVSSPSVASAPKGATPAADKSESKVSSITAALQREEQLASSNVIVVYGVIFGVLAFLFWLSGDGNTLRLRQALNALTGYAFEAELKKPKPNNPYGAFSSV